MDKLLSEGFKRTNEAAFMRGRALHGKASLWPPPYNEPTYESRVRFVHDLVWTWNETNRETAQLPLKDYIDWVIWEWGDCKSIGQALIFEKSRRLMISWLCRSLELHDMGLQQGSVFVGDQIFAGARKHVWRAHFLYEEIRQRNPKFLLKKAIHYGPLADKKLDSLILPNGSIFTSLNSEPESYRGDGVTIVALEEGSAYDHLDSTFGQALTVTKGRPGVVGGFTVIIANTSKNKAWQAIKARRDA